MCDFDSRAGWTNVKSLAVKKKKEKKRFFFLLIDRRSARSIFCVLLIADFSRSSSLEGISSANHPKIISKEKLSERERERRRFSVENCEIWFFFRI